MTNKYLRTNKGTDTEKGIDWNQISKEKCYGKES